MRHASMKLTIAANMCAMLAVCGDSPGGRALTGGAIGAGTGAILGGAATTRNQVNLGPAP
jgi:osmotically inducible lipoprotein OsmB